jgi:hypothetical protein
MIATDYHYLRARGIPWHRALVIVLRRAWFRRRIRRLRGAK